MSNISQGKCKNCGKTFIKKSEKNIFCSRRCFKKNYYYIERERKKKNDTEFPMYKCPKCGQVIKMEVHPIRDNFRWLEWHNKPCPGCNTLMIYVNDELIAEDEANA